RWQIEVPMPPMPPVTYATFCAMSNSSPLVGLGCLTMPPQCDSAARESPSLGKSALDGERHAHAATDAQRRDAALGVALLHFVQQGDEDAASRRADGVADGDGAAIHV